MSKANSINAEVHALDVDETIANEIVNRQKEFIDIRRKLAGHADEGFPLVEVVNYNERDEAIIIEVAVLMRANWAKRLLLVPLLSILTLLIFPIFLYWSAYIRSQWFYSTAHTLEEATHVLIVGRGK
jgi:hypothetical protein